MLARFEADSVKVSARVDSIPLGLDRHEIVTLASIVEAETGIPSERPRIAAVYLNRLADEWKLQADPTVRYALGKYERDRVFYKDLTVESPYNTYWVKGLPPGPIASPGYASLEATLSPLVPCEDFFFVAAGNRGHVYSKTLREHRSGAKGAPRRCALKRREERVDPLPG